MTETRPAETNSGIVTEWLPVTTAYSAPEACSSTFLAHGDVLTGYPLVAFDPNLGLYVNTSLRCLPPQATAWWTQEVLGLTGTTTLLGPFTCPNAYSTASTSVVNSLSTAIACCPSGYGFVKWESGGTADQCTSALSTNQIYTLANQTAYQDGYALETFSVTTTMKVTAVQVNGYIFNSASTTSGLASSLSSSTSVSTSTLTSGQSSKDGHGTISTGAVIGIAVGAAILGVAASLIIGWFVLRRYRREAFQGPPNYELGRGEEQPVYAKGSDPTRSEMATVEVAQELYGVQGAHELHGSYGNRS